MNDYKFDLDMFLECCKEFGIEVKKGSGKILIEENEVRVSEIIEEKLYEAKMIMDTQPQQKINGISGFTYTVDYSHSALIAA